jgi:Cu/Ag efflux pump CusA
VQLQQLADVRLSSVPNIIRHDAVSRYIDMSFTVQGRDFGAVVADVQRALGELQFPLEFHAQVLSGYAERQAVLQEILGIIAVVAITIYLLMQACYQNWRLAALSFLSLPLALVGGLLTASLAGGIISIGSLVGFLTVLGITARNGIMMVRHYQTVEQPEETFSPAWVVRRSGERAVAIVMTALTTGLAFVPLVITGNIPGQELVYPMAIVILGGLVTSTLVNLFVVPTLYLRFGPKPALAAPDAQPDLDKAALQPTPG